MKKIYISAIIILLAFCFSGCKAVVSGFSPVVSNISFEAQIDTPEDSFLYEASSDKDGNISFKAISPDEIKDFCYFIGKENCEISFGDVVSPAPKEKTGVLGEIYDIFAFSQKNCKTAKKDNDMYILSGESDFGKFKIIFAQSGIPISAELSDGTIIYFKNVKLKGL